MGIFLLHDLLQACTLRFKRSKIDYETHKMVWEGLKLWIAFQYDNGRGCELPHFGRIVLQSEPGLGDRFDTGHADKPVGLIPNFVLSSRASSRYGLKHAKAPAVAIKRLHVAKLNHVAISEAVSVDRDTASEGVKQLLWCLLEAMANRKDVLIDIGVGDLKCRKGQVCIDFDREPGKGFKGPRALAPLTAQSEGGRTVSRSQLQSSASTLRPPSHAGTELDWDSLSVTSSRAGLSSRGGQDAMFAGGSSAGEGAKGHGHSSSANIMTIPEDREEEGAYEALESESQSQPRESVETLPPIGGGGASPPDEEDLEQERARLNTEFLENHKSNKDWLAAYAGTDSKSTKDRYLDKVFDRYEHALRSSEEALREEAVELQRATLTEDKLRSAMRQQKRHQRHAIAGDLKLQMKDRAKRDQKAALEELIVSAPKFPQTERGLLSAEQRKKARLREYLDRQVSENASRLNVETRYELIQEQLKLRDDAHRYQDEILEDVARRKAAGRALCSVWDRQRSLKVLAGNLTSLM